MATAAELRQRVYDYLYGQTPTEKPFESIITASYTNVATTVAVTDGDDWSEGDIVENIETGEQMLVTSVSVNNLTVVRAQNQTTAAASSGTDDQLRKNPRFTIKELDDALEEALNAMGRWGIHGFDTGSLTLVASQWFYGITETDVSPEYGVLAVYYPDTTTEIPVGLPFRYLTDISTAPSEYSVGQGIVLMSKGDRATTDTLYYTYAQSYDFDTDLDTTIAKVELAHEELVVTAAVSRVFGHSISPATQDPGRRTDRTVPPGQTTRDGRWYQGVFFIEARAEQGRVALRRLRLPGTVRGRRGRRWQQ